jgi:hypothetical protein
LNRPNILVVAVVVTVLVAVLVAELIAVDEAVVVAVVVWVETSQPNSSPLALSVVAVFKAAIASLRTDDRMATPRLSQAKML